MPVSSLPGGSCAGNRLSCAIIYDLYKRTEQENDMPIHEYKCQACGCRTEALQKLRDKPLQKCPKCGGPLGEAHLFSGHPIQRLGLLHHGLRPRTFRPRKRRPGTASQPTSLLTSPARRPRKRPGRSPRPGLNPPSPPPRRTRRPPRRTKPPRNIGTQYPFPGNRLFQGAIRSAGKSGTRYRVPLFSRSPDQCHGRRSIPSFFLRLST